MVHRLLTVLGVVRFLRWLGVRNCRCAHRRRQLNALHDRLARRFRALIS